jgi:multicomponent Na+:H+ antiporter subunit E
MFREDAVNHTTNEKSGSSLGNKDSRLKAFLSFLITFVLMFICWIVLSGKFEPLLLVLGFVSSFLVAYYFYDLMMPVMERSYLGMFFRWNCYIPWLLLEIMKANFHMLYISFHPRMAEKIEPQIITFKTRLKSDIAIATLANSITLTPGTITITADADGVFRVHAIDRECADALPGTMAEKVARIFGEQV